MIARYMLSSLEKKRKVFINVIETFVEFQGIETLCRRLIRA